MPNESLPVLLLFTDTVTTQLRDVGAYSGILSQYKLDDCQIHVVSLFEATKNQSVNFGYISNKEMFSYIAHTTGGRYTTLSRFVHDAILPLPGLSNPSNKISSTTKD
jgi:hypothetical protein